LIAARKAGIHLVFDRACAIDLATKGTGKTVLEAVKTSVNPKVIDAPNPASGKTTIEGVAKDGIIIKAKARVTVRTNLDRFVGGATEETIIARVGEGIVTTIGTANSYKDVLENPDRISKTVLSKALDSNTAFEILSIDIADVFVGENVGAKLQAEQAEANKLIAQAQAEVRRAAAVALEQEMLARVQEMRARVVEAEAQVPLAMAEAFRLGHLGVALGLLEVLFGDGMMIVEVVGAGEGFLFHLVVDARFVIVGDGACQVTAVEQRERGAFLDVIPRANLHFHDASAGRSEDADYMGGVRFDVRG